MQLEDVDLLSIDVSHQQQRKAIKHGKTIAVSVANGVLAGLNQTLLLILPVALFLPSFSIGFLPLAYASIIIVNFILHKLHDRFSCVIHSLKPTFFYGILSAIVILGLWWDLSYYTHIWIPFALLVVSVPLISLSNMQLSELNRALVLNNMYGIRRAVNICQLGAIGIGGLITPLLILAVGVLDSLIILFFTLLVHSIFVYFSPKLSIKPVEKTEITHVSHNHSRETTIYIIRLFIYSGLGVFGFYFINMLFNNIIKAEFVNSEGIALFLGGFFAVVGFLSLILYIFINKYLVNRLGIAVLLNLWPGLTIITATVIVVFMPSPMVVIPLIIGLQLADEVLRRGTLGEIRSLIHQPLSPEDRVWVENKVRPIIRLVAGLSASLAMGVLYGYHGVDITFFAIAIISVAVIMLYLIPGVKKLYTLSLVKALSKHNLIAPEFTILDKTSLGLLKAGLKSPHVEVGLYSLNVLEKTNVRFFPQAIEYCLQHKEQTVRKHALTKIRKHHFLYLKKEILHCVHADPSPEVRGEALVTLGTIVGVSAISMIKPYLDDDQPAIRAGAIISLLQFCGTDGALLASDKLNDMVSYPVVSERLLAAKILAAIDIQEFHKALKALLNDSNREVRKAALEVTSKIPSPEIIDILIDCLKHTELRISAIRALSKFNKLAIPKLERALEENENIPDIFKSITIILSQINSPIALEAIYRYIDHPNAKVRNSCFSALHQYHFHAVSAAVNSKVSDLLKKEALIAIDILGSLNDIEEGIDTSVLVNLLESQFRQQQENIIYLLSFYYPEKGIMRAWDNIQSNNTEICHHGIELLEGLLTVAHKNLLIPLLERIPHSQRIQRLPPSDLQQSKGMPDRLRCILNKATYLNPLIQASALYAATKMNLNNVAQLAKDKLQNPNPVIRETALWSLWFLRHVDFAEHVRQMINDPSPTVAKTAKSLLRG